MLEWADELLIGFLGFIAGYFSRGERRARFADWLASSWNSLAREIDSFVRTGHQLFESFATAQRNQPMAGQTWEIEGIGRVQILVVNHPCRVRYEKEEARVGHDEIAFVTLHHELRVAKTSSVFLNGRRVDPPTTSEP